MPLLTVHNGSRLQSAFDQCDKGVSEGLVPTESSFNILEPGMIQIKEERPKTKKDPLKLMLFW